MLFRDKRIPLIVPPRTHIVPQARIQTCTPSSQLFSFKHPWLRLCMHEICILYMWKYKNTYAHMHADTRTHGQTHTHTHTHFLWRAAREDVKNENKTISIYVCVFLASSNTRVEQHQQQPIGHNSHENSCVEKSKRVCVLDVFFPWRWCWWWWWCCRCRLCGMVHYIGYVADESNAMKI